MSKQFYRPIDVEHNMHIESDRVMLLRVSAPLDSFLINSMRGIDIQSSIYKQESVAAVRVTMPQEEFELLMEVYRSHHAPQSNNPAVCEAWHQYRMLLALTK